MKVKTVWDYSANSEAERLLFTAHQIAVGFYRVNNFIVLPGNPKVKSAQIVNFPDLPYNKIPRFWDQAKRADIPDFAVNVDKKFLDQTVKLVTETNFPKPNFEKTRRAWEKAQNEILNEIYKIMPSKKNIVKEIIIHPTTLGTSCSFNLINKYNRNGKILIYLREDGGIYSITEAIVSSLTRQDVFNKLNGLWSESEILADWLVTESSLSKVLQKYEKAENYIATIKGIRTKQQANLLKQSEGFYKKLGIPNFDKPFSLNGLTPEINKKPVENLSLKERLILKKLIENANSAVSFDNIADEIFKGDNNFSLYAISKTIERLRNKLEANGISGSYIQTLRGQGYVLRN